MPLSFLHTVKRQSSINKNHTYFGHILRDNETNNLVVMFDLSEAGAEYDTALEELPIEDIDLLSSILDQLKGWTQGYLTRNTDPGGSL